MSPLETKPETEEFTIGGVVSPVPELAWVQPPEGGQVDCETLGPGIIEAVDNVGQVLVHWTDAGFTHWIDGTDLHSEGPDAHLISVYHRNEHGELHLSRRKLATHKGLTQNWTVELLPLSIVRAIRSDGLAWTFKYNWIFEKIEVWWPRPPKDEDAEALLVAELAVQ